MNDEMAGARTLNAMCYGIESSATFSGICPDEVSDIERLSNRCSAFGIDYVSLFNKCAD